MWQTIVAEYGVFILKAVTVLVLVAVVLGIASKSKKEQESGEITVTDLTKKLRNQQEKLEATLLGEKELKKLEKRKKSEKEEPSNQERSKLFVLEFDGGVKASEVDELREEITAIIALAKPGDEVLLKLESPGGVVHGYGLAASQLVRLRERGIFLTVAVDKVAASGGYMMACVADKIVAAPFSVVGSIGVVAEVPNIHRLLKKHDIDVDVMTAGEYKRTVTFLGENTEEGRQKFEQKLQVTHDLFKEFVQQNRPQLDIERIATGETWYGTQALALNLVDAVSTSDDVLLEAAQERSVYLIAYKEKQTLVQSIGLQIEMSLENLATKFLYKSNNIL